MASINYTQSLNNTDFYSNDFQSSSVSTWNEPESLNLVPESFADFETSIFFEDSENDNTLLQASKKISKSSNSSYKKSKRARNPWTPREDAKLMDLMKKYGQSWAMISSQLEGRTGKQVRDRYLNKLRPNIKCGDWSAEEDNLLVKLLKEVGNRWSLIATHLPTRTEGQVKNRYYSYIKKRLQPDGTLCLTANDNKANSEDITSHNTSPRIEENNFDFANEFDMNLMNGSTMNFQPEPIYNNNFNSFTNGNFAITKGPYGTEEEIYSERSTTQGSNSQSGSNSPLRVNLVDPTDVISYDVAETFFYRQPSVCRPFHVAPIQHDGQVDNMLSKVTSYFVETSNKGSEVDSFFSRDASFPQAESDERLSQLNMRKAYLELALAKTLEEINGF